MSVLSTTTKTVESSNDDRGDSKIETIRYCFGVSMLVYLSNHVTNQLRTEFEQNDARIAVTFLANKMENLGYREYKELILISEITSNLVDSIINTKPWEYNQGLGIYWFQSIYGFMNGVHAQ